MALPCVLLWLINLNPQFYGNLATLITKYSNKCKDFCAARSVEKEQLLR